MKLPVLSYLVKFAIVFLCTVQRAQRTEAGKAGAPLEPDNSLPMKTVAIEGASAMLPCRFTTPSRDAVRLIFWYKGANATGQPLYIVDARNKSLVTATHFPGDLVGRMSFDVSSSALRIHSVLAEDHGLHYCRVDFRRSRTVVSALMLDVVVPPRKILLLDEFSQIMSTTIGPFDEASSLYVVCESEGGIPAPQLTWYLDSEVIKNDTSSVIGNKVVRTWLNMTLTRNHYNKTLTCKAHNSYFSISKSVAVDMNLHPTRISIISSRDSYSSGTSVQIECQTFGSKPSAEIIWFFNNKLLSGASESFAMLQNSSVSFTKSVLELHLGREDDGSHLRCRAQNKVFVDTYIEDTLRLVVHYPPTVQLTWRGNFSSSLETNKEPSSSSLMSSMPCIPVNTMEDYKELRHANRQLTLRDTICLNEGDDILFHCTIHSNPSAHLIKWFFNGQVVGGDRYNGVVISGETLFLRPVAREHSGKFTCSASNTEGSASSGKVTLNVRHAPICKTAQKIFYGVASGESVQVSCEVNANPRNVSFVWSMGNRTLPSANDDVIGTKSYIKLSPHSLQDYGTVSCRAANAIGSQVEPCLFTILPAGPPEPLQGCTLANSTSLLFHVSCIPGYDGGLPQSIHLDVYESTSDKSLEVFTQLNDANFTLRQLTPNRTYIIHVYSSNAKGRSSSLVLPLTTAPVRVSKEPMQEVAMETIILLVGSMLMTVLIVTTATYLLFTKLRKNQSHKDEWTEMAIPTNPDVIPSDKEMLEVDDSIVEGLCKTSEANGHDFHRVIFQAHQVPYTSSSPGFSHTLLTSL